MKSLFKAAILIASLLLAFAANTWAIPVTEGAKIQMYANDTPTPYEGHYQFTAAGKSYGTFCVELNEYFSSSGTYKVSTIENYARSGGIGGQDQPGADPLSNATKWLFGHFLSKDIESATNTTTENDYALQLAIWKLEGELSAPAPSGGTKYIDEYNASSLARAYVTAANSSGSAGAAYDVKVMNLTSLDGNNLAQSQLVGTAPVPEPSTFLLLGIGLGGFAIWRRKKSA